MERDRRRVGERGSPQRVRSEAERIAVRLMCFRPHLMFSRDKVRSRKSGEES